MTDILASRSSITPDFDKEKCQHYGRINKLRCAYAQEMANYIERYVLEGRELLEVLRIAHQDVLDYVRDEECLSMGYVMEHILTFEDLFKKQGDFSED